jgi:hypothetical protein
VDAKNSSENNLRRWRVRAVLVLWRWRGTEEPILGVLPWRCPIGLRRCSRNGNRCEDAEFPRVLLWRVGGRGPLRVRCLESGRRSGRWSRWCPLFGPVSGFWTWTNTSSHFLRTSHSSPTGNRTLQRSNAIAEPQVPPAARRLRDHTPAAAGDGIAEAQAPPAAQRLRDHLRLHVIPPLGALPSARRPGTAPTRATPIVVGMMIDPRRDGSEVGVSFIYRP